MLNIKNIILSIFIFVAFVTISALYAGHPGKVGTGAIVIGAGKAIKNSKTFKEAMDVTKEAVTNKDKTAEEETNDEVVKQSEQTHNNYPNKNNNETETNLIEDIFSHTQNSFVKQNQKNLNDIEKGIDGFKNFGAGITKALSKSGENAGKTGIKHKNTVPEGNLANHIFSGKAGKLTDTSANRDLIT
jgi:DNA anti-recombination protein RmuC